jgi:L-lactate dehydrogenase (cytochrome)
MRRIARTSFERALGLMRTEIERDMKLMGCTSIKQLSRSNLRFRS